MTINGPRKSDSDDRLYESLRDRIINDRDITPEERREQLEELTDMVNSARGNDVDYGDIDE